MVSGGPVMFARIGMMRALNRGTEPQGLGRKRANRHRVIG